MGYKYALTAANVRIILLLAIVTAAAVTDLKGRVISDKLNMAGFALGVPLLLIEPKEVIFSGVAGFIAGGALFYIIALISHGGVGGGDIKLVAVIGLLMGLKEVILVTGIAFGIGGIVGLPLLLIKKKKELPFAPFLAMGTVALVALK